MTEPMTMSLVIQCGALGLLALVLWFAGKAAQTFLASWLKAYVEAAKSHGAAIDSVRKSIDETTEASRSMRLTLTQHHGEMREHVTSEARETRHDVRGALAVVLKEVEDCEDGAGRSGR